MTFRENGVGGEKARWDRFPLCCWRGGPPPPHVVVSLFDVKEKKEKGGLSTKCSPSCVVGEDGGVMSHPLRNAECRVRCPIK